MRFHKPVGIFLLLWPTVWALFLLSAGGQPTLTHLWVFIAGVVLMRAAGCIMNDLADRPFDVHVKRTRHRPLVTAAVSVRGAVGLCLFLLLLAATITWCYLPLVCFYWAIGAVICTAVYPLMKRITHWPQLVLGIAFSWSIPMVTAATGHVFNISVWLLWGIAACWPVAYDTQYALMDREDDCRIGVRSSAIALGEYAIPFVMLLQTLIAILWLLLAWLQGWTAWILLPWLLAVLTLVYQYSCHRQQHTAAILRAFLTNQYTGCCYFVLILVGNYS